MTTDTAAFVKEEIVTSIEKMFSLKVSAVTPIQRGYLDEGKLNLEKTTAFIEGYREHKNYPKGKS